MPKFNDYFNSTTIRGRANVAKATYASLAALYLYIRFKKGKKNSKDNSVRDTSHEQQSQDSAQYHYKSSALESSKENENFSDEKANKRQDLHEASSLSDHCDSNQSSSFKPDHNRDNTVAVAESIVNSKSRYGGKYFKEDKGDYYLDSPPPDKGSCP